MRITKFGHACVRLEHDGARLVIDPGVFTDVAALEGADAVLITHEHADHYTPEHLAAVDAPVFTIDSVAAKIRDENPELGERITVVRPDETFEAAGLPVRAVGELHAVIHPDYPRIHNSGYVVTAGGLSAYHPGDALTVPGQDVDVLLAPVSAPWLKMSEAVDFVRAVGAPRAMGIHDRIYSEAGLGFVETHMGNLLPAGQSFVRVADGEDLA